MARKSCPSLLQTTELFGCNFISSGKTLLGTAAANAPPLEHHSATASNELRQPSAFRCTLPRGNRTNFRPSSEVGFFASALPSIPFPSSFFLFSLLFILPSLVLYCERTKGTCELQLNAEFESSNGLYQTDYLSPLFTDLPFTRWGRVSGQ